MWQLTGRRLETRAVESESPIFPTGCVNFTGREHHGHSDTAPRLQIPEGMDDTLSTFDARVFHVSLIVILNAQYPRYFIYTRVRRSDQYRQ